VSLTVPIPGSLLISPCTLGSAVPGLSANGTGLLYDSSIGSLETLYKVNGDVSVTMQGTFVFALNVSASHLVIVGSTTLQNVTVLEGRDHGLHVNASLAVLNFVTLRGSSSTNYGVYFKSGLVTGQGNPLARLDVYGSSTGAQPGILLDGSGLMEIPIFKFYGQGVNQGCSLRGGGTIRGNSIPVNITWICTSNGTISGDFAIFWSSFQHSTNGGSLHIEATQHGSQGDAFYFASGQIQANGLTILGTNTHSSAGGVPVTFASGSVAAESTRDFYLKGVNGGNALSPAIEWKGGILQFFQSSGTPHVWLEGYAPGAPADFTATGYAFIIASQGGSTRNITFKGALGLLGNLPNIVTGNGDSVRFLNDVKGPLGFSIACSNANVTFEGNVNVSSLEFPNNFRQLEINAVNATIVKGNGQYVLVRGLADIAQSTWTVKHITVFATAGKLQSLPKLASNGSVIVIEGGSYSDLDTLDFSPNNNTIYVGFGEAASTIVLTPAIKFGPLCTLVVKAWSTTVADKIIAGGADLGNVSVWGSGDVVNGTMAPFLEVELLTGITAQYLPWAMNPFGVEIVDNNAFLVYNTPTCTYRWDSVGKVLTFNISANIDVSAPDSASLKIDPCSLDGTVPGLSVDGTGLKYSASAGGDPNALIEVSGRANVTVTGPEISLALNVNASKIDVSGFNTISSEASFTATEYGFSLINMLFYNVLRISGTSDGSRPGVEISAIMLQGNSLYVDGTSLGTAPGIKVYSCQATGASIYSFVGRGVNQGCYFDQAGKLDGSNANVTIICTANGTSPGDYALLLQNNFKVETHGGPAYVEVNQIGGYGDGLIMNNGAEIRATGLTVLATNFDNTTNGTAFQFMGINPRVVCEGSGNMTVKATNGANGKTPAIYWVPNWNGGVFDIQASGTVWIEGSSPGAVADIFSDRSMFDGSASSDKNVTILGRVATYGSASMSAGNGDTWVFNSRINSVEGGILSFAATGARVFFQNTVQLDGLSITGFEWLNLMQFNVSALSGSGKRVEAHGRVIVGTSSWQVEWIRMYVSGAYLNDLPKIASNGSSVEIEDGSYSDLDTLDFSPNNNTIYVGFGEAASTILLTPAIKFGPLCTLFVKAWSTTVADKIIAGGAELGNVSVWGSGDVVDGTMAPFLEVELLSGLTGQYLPWTMNPFGVQRVLNTVYLVYKPLQFVENVTATATATPYGTITVPPSPSSTLAVSGPTGVIVSWVTVAPAPVSGLVTLFGAACTASLTAGANWPSDCTIQYSAPGPTSTIASYTYALGLQDGNGNVWATKTIEVVVPSNGFIAVSNVTTSFTPSPSPQYAIDPSDLRAAGQGTVTWNTAGPSPTAGSYGAIGSCQNVGNNVLMPPEECVITYSGVPACTTQTVSFGVQVGNQDPSTWATKTFTVVVEPTSTCTSSSSTSSTSSLTTSTSSSTSSLTTTSLSTSSSTSSVISSGFADPAAVSTTIGQGSTYTMPNSVAIAMQGGSPTTVAWATAEDPIPTGSFSGQSCVGWQTNPGPANLPEGCEFIYVPSPACTQYVDSFGLAVGSSGGAVWATKSFFVTVSPTATCTTITTFSSSSLFVTSLSSSETTSTSTKDSVSTSSTSSSDYVSTSTSSTSDSVSASTTATGESSTTSISLQSSASSTSTSQSSSSISTLQISTSVIPTSSTSTKDSVSTSSTSTKDSVSTSTSSSDSVSTSTTATGESSTTSISLQSSASSTSTSQSSSSISTLQISTSVIPTSSTSTKDSVSTSSTSESSSTTHSPAITYGPAPGGKVGSANVDTTDEEITNASTNTEAPAIVPASGIFDASPVQSSRGSPIRFVQKLTTSRVLQAYLLDSLVIRQPGTAFSWTIVNGALKSSPMAENVEFNLTNVRITPTADGEVEMSFDLTPNTCGNKIACLVNTTEAQVSTPTLFEANLTVRAFLQSAPGVLQYGSLSLASRFSVVGNALVYVSAPGNKVGVAEANITTPQIDEAGSNIGSPIVTPGSLNPASPNTSVAAPVRFTQKFKSNRALQVVLLGNLTVKKPTTGASWTLVAGSQKQNPISSTVKFSLEQVTIAPSGTGEVEIVFDMTPNVCSDPTTCMLSPADTQSISTLFEIDLETIAYAYPIGQLSGSLELQIVSQSSQFTVLGTPLIYGPAPGDLVGVAGTLVTSQDISTGTINVGGSILTSPGTLAPGKPSTIIGSMVDFTSSVQHKRLIKAFLLKDMIIRQSGSAFTWQLVKDGKETALAPGMQFNLDNVEITADAQGTVVAKFSVIPNVCNIKANCLMTIPESQNPAAVIFEAILTIRAFADGVNSLEYQDLEQKGSFSMTGVAPPFTSSVTSTTIVIPTTGFTFDPTSNIAMNTLIDGQDVAAATALPTATATRIVSAVITRLSTLPISTTLAAPTPIIFQAVYDAVQDSRPLLGAQVWKFTVSRLETPIRTYNLVSGGVQLQPLAGQLQFDSLVTINADGSNGVAFMWINANQTILGTGPLLADITMRWFVESPSARKRAVPLAYVQLSRKAVFAINSTTTSTTKTGIKTTTRSTIKSIKSSGKATTTRIPQPTNWIIAQTCKVGGKYDNPKHCCCAPNVTKRVTATKTVTVRRGAKATSNPKRDVEALIGKDEIFGRQVSPQHLCDACPIARPQSKVVCCLPRKTITRVAKTLYKTRTI
jgi:hypothetical protein